MFGSHRFLHAFPTWGEFHLYSRTERWTKDWKDSRQHYCTQNNFFSILFSGLYFLSLTEKASFSMKCAIPLGYFASCLDPEFTKTRRRGKNKEFLLTSSRCWGHLKSAFYSCNLLPTVQNCPNLFWEATLRPFSRVVILVSYFSWASTEANTGLGMPGSGVEREIFGYPPPLLYFL